MPTIALKVQQNGTLQDYSALVGASFAYQAVDDSDGTTHDSAATYITITRQRPRISFPLFLQVEGLIPSSITINVVARNGGGAHPRLQIGFYRSGVSGLDAGFFDPSTSWTLRQTIFSVNPITGNPWSQSDPIGLEVLVQNETGISGSNDVTLISGSLIGVPLTNRLLRLPSMEVTG